MEVRFRENTGMKNPQENNLDFFSIKKIGADLEFNSAHTTIYFWLTSEDALANKAPVYEREIEWPIIEESDVTSGVAKVLEFNNKETLSGDFVSINGSVIVN